MGGSAAALSAYERAVTLWPGNATAHYDLATVLATTGAQEDLRLAEGHLRDALRAQAEFLDARLQLATVLALEARIDEALDELRRAEDRHGRTPDILFARAQVHLRRARM